MLQKKYCRADNRLALSILSRGPVLCLVFASLLDTLIQRLQHSCVHGGDHIDGRIELFFRHPCFPCVRKAPVNSRIAEPHHRDGETDEHLLPLGETLHRMRIAIKSSEVGFLQVLAPLFSVV
jgi:hypothetical protein